MPTREKSEIMKLRETVRETHGDKCCVCGAGPLMQRGMHLVEEADISPVPLPMCKECAQSWDGSEAGMKGSIMRMAECYAAAVIRMKIKYPEAKTTDAPLL